MQSASVWAYPQATAIAPTAPCINSPTIPRTSLILGLSAEHWVDLRSSIACAVSFNSLLGGSVFEELC
jgi:hypothetical protein